MDSERLTDELALNLHEKIKLHLAENPFESIIDTEDESYQRNPVVVEKFASQSGRFYCEFDQRLRFEQPDTQEHFEANLQNHLFELLEFSPVHYIRRVDV